MFYCRKNDVTVITLAQHSMLNFSYASYYFQKPEKFGILKYTWLQKDCHPV